MESIRINISKHLSHEGMVPVIAYPSEAAYDFRVHHFPEDMSRLSTLMAWEMRIYPDGRNVQLSLIKDLQGGFIQYAILVDSSKLTLAPRQMTESLKQMAAAYESLVADDPKPSKNPQFQKSISDIYKELSASPLAGLPERFPVPESTSAPHPTYYMKYKTEGEVETLLKFPIQEFFQHTPSIFLVPSTVQPSDPKMCRQVRSIVLRTFKITSADGHEYGEVKEGEVKRISLRGKEGMLPMTIDVRGDVSQPSPYGYYDTTTNTIRIDERGIKFYYELKFLVKYNGRLLRSCLVRHNGEQVLPDSNGNYVIKVYESDINDAGVIHFSGENFKDADIRVTPGVVRQLEYVFTPEPQHDIAHVTLDFGDGRPIQTTIDVGTNERLFQQLQKGRVKGYTVKQEGEEYKMFIPRKLTQASKNTLRMLKALFMIGATLALYALVAYGMTRHWPWPIEQAITRTHKPVPKPVVNRMGEVTEVTQEEADEDSTLIVDDTDQVKLEAMDADYLRTNDIWRRDSIRSNKFKDIVNTVFNGSLSEIRMKNYDQRVIANSWWEQIWRQVVVPNAIHRDKVKLSFTKSMSTDRNTLDVKRLYEELNTHLTPSDGPAVKTW